MVSIRKEKRSKEVKDLKYQTNTPMIGKKELEASQNALKLLRNS